MSGAFGRVSARRGTSCGSIERLPMRPLGLCGFSGRCETSMSLAGGLEEKAKRPYAGRKALTVRAALFETPPFQPSKLTISFSDNVSAASLESRRYTLTHSDVSGQLWLTVGSQYNLRQISGFYTRLLRDEVVAEWRCGSHAEDGDTPALHLFCHVSGEERWLAPPELRNYIFRREMPLVLDCVAYAERELLQARPELAEAKVYVHFQSELQHLDRVECWGVLGDRSTWRAVPVSLLKRMLDSVLGRSLDDPGLADEPDVAPPAPDSGIRASTKAEASIAFRMLQEDLQRFDEKYARRSLRARMLAAAVAPWTACSIAAATHSQWHHWMPWK